jgi:hypothetical protein
MATTSLYILLSYMNVLTPMYPANPATVAHLRTLTVISRRAIDCWPFFPALSIALTSSSVSSMSPTSKKPSRRSFLDEMVTMTALSCLAMVKLLFASSCPTHPFAFDHARSTCSGLIFSLLAMSFMGLSTGPPGRDVSGIRDEYPSGTMWFSFI